MRIRKFTNKITSKVGRQVLITQKHSPAILFGTGVVGFVATVVFATRATLKLEEVLKEAEENSAKVEIAETIAKTSGRKYTEEDKKKDKLFIKTKAAVEVVKLYGPAMVIGAFSLTCLTGSHVILSRRNVALTATYAAIEKGFKEYRARVVKEYGEAKDHEFRFGVVERTIGVDTDEGVVEKTIRGVDQEEMRKSGGSIYARVFDEGSKNWRREWTYNQMFIRAQQNYANDLLKARGHVFLNEVYDMLGLDRSSEGAVVGWVKDGEGDGYIDFGVFEGDIYSAQRFVNGDERSVLLDFNVDGVVYDLI